MPIPNKPSFAWKHLAVLSLACLLNLSAHAAITEWQLNKISVYTQSTDNLASATADSWRVEVMVEVDTDENIDATAATISGGGISGHLDLEWDTDEWVLEKEYLSKAALDAEFPSNDSYTIELSGGALGTVTQSVTIGVDNYPNVPYFTGTVFSELSSLDAGNDFDFTWGTSGSSTGIYFEIFRDNPWQEFAEEDLPNSATSYTLLADTLPSGETFEGALYFANGTTAPAGGFGVGGSVRHANGLIFNVTTSASGGTPAVLEWSLEKGALYFQESDDTAPSTADTWFFYAEIETANEADANSATLSGGNISGSLPLTFEEDEWVLVQEYASEAQLNAAHPTGATYDLTLSGGDLGTITQEVTFSIEDAPNTPYLTGSDFSRVRSMDASADFDFHWNVAGPNGNFLEIEFDEDGVDVEANPGTPEIGTLPSNILNPGYRYPAEIFSANEQLIDGTGGFGVEGFISVARVTKFSAFTVLSNHVDPIVGAWQSGNGAADASSILVLQADGTYFYAEDSESDGMERGTYTWDANSGELIATPNTNVPSGPTSSSFTATVDDDTLNLTNSSSTNYERINDPANAIVGGWRLCDNQNSDTGVLVFLDNGVYFHAEVSPTDGSGMERGTYSWNASTGSLTVNSTPLDTNIETGLNGAGTLSAVTTGRKVLTIADTTYLYRVSNAAVLPDWRLTKSRSYSQTANNTEPTNSTQWSIWSTIELRNANDATSITLSGEDGSGTPFSHAYYEESPGEWTFDPSNYITEAALDADYPNGTTFTITLSGGELGTLSQEVECSGIYPTAPYLTGTTWSDAQEIYPAAEFALNWNSPASGSVQLLITSQMDESGDEYFEQSGDALTLNSASIPVGVIPAGGDAYGYLEFSQSAYETYGQGGFGAYGFTANQSTLLDFPLRRLNTGEVIENAFTDAGLTEPEDRELGAAPFDDGVENLLKYAFNMDLSGPDSSTLSSGGSSGLPAGGLVEDAEQTVWQIKFVRPKDSGLIYTPQKTTNLNNAFVPMTGAVSTQDIGSGLERVTISEPYDPETTPACFSIIKVSLPK